MIFLGTTFCSGKYTLSPAPYSIAEITAIQLFDGTYNHLLLSTNASMTVKNFDTEWTFDTKLNASFDKNLEAGNVGFSTKTTDTLVIKRREIGTYDWITIYAKEIKNSDDFNISIRDTYARASTEYEYSMSSFCNGTENGYVIRNVYSDFDGFYITDKDCLYGTIYDIDGCNTSRNLAAQTLELLNSKYMAVVSNSELNSDSGSISGTFLKLNEADTPDLSGSLEYRKDFKSRLANKRPLILKIDDGRIWMIKVSSNPTDIVGEHRNIRQINFEWVEIGDVNDMRSLYLNGFSDVDSKWWK